MRKQLKGKAVTVLGIVFGCVVLLPMTVFAPVTFASGGGASSGDGGGAVNPGGSVSIINPIQSQTIDQFLLKIIDVILIFALPIIILYIMYAGFLFVTARGEEAQISKARKALLWAVIGGVVVIGAKLIISVIQGTISAF